MFPDLSLLPTPFNAAYFRDTTLPVCGKIQITTAAPKGAMENDRVMASLKRSPDTNLRFFRSLLSRFLGADFSFGLLDSCRQQCSCLLQFSSARGAEPAARPINKVGQHS